jgi:xylulokinase
MYWMGIDVGTGGTRALLLDGNGRVAGACTVAHEPMAMARPLWAEQRPEDWAHATIGAIRGALAQADVQGSDVRGIGLSGQMHGLVMLDFAGTVIRPSLIWCDQRSQAQVEMVHARVGKQKVVEAIANPMLTGFTLPKLLWVREHEPQLFDRLSSMLLPKDYVRFILTGERITDVSDASGTGMFDVGRRQWSTFIMDALNLDRAILPSVVESSDVAGEISFQIARQTGLAAGTPVVGGGGDQAASAVGNGIVKSGAVSCTLGTSGVVFAHTDEIRYDPLGRVHTFCHAVRGKWHVMGVTQGAGLSLQWFRNQFAPGVEYDTLMAEAAGAPAGSQGLFWLPYLMGERTPHLDAQARGGWIGLTGKHTRADLIRSVIEGVCYSQKDALDLITALGVSADTVRLSGGGARSKFWRQMMADVLNRRVATLESQEGSAIGAALLAMVGTGEYSNVEEACERHVRETESLAPGPEASYYSNGHSVFQALYPALQPLFARMT